MDIEPVAGESHASKRGELIAILCRRFKLEYEQLLRDTIAGARVSECRTKGLVPIYFDIPVKGGTDE
jgi:hypothetical protein